MNSQPVQEYLNFLWNQMQYDWSVFSNPWVLYTIIPALLYLLFFIVKWYVLLAPITIPITTYTQGLLRVAQGGTDKKDNTTVQELTKLIKG